MKDIEKIILDEIYSETGKRFAALEVIPVISCEANKQIYRVLLKSIHKVDDTPLRWVILHAFLGPGADDFLFDLLALLPAERDTWNQSTLYQAIGHGINSRNAEKVWGIIENNVPTEGYLIFAERILKIRSLRDRVIAKLVQHAESGQLSEDLMLGLANSKADEVAETARRILGPHPELRHTVRRKLPRGLWRKVFEPGETAGGPVLIHSFNCDLESAIEDLREQHPLAAETMLSRDVTIDHIASIPEGKMAALPGEPGLVLHRVDITELEVFIYDRVESSKQRSQ